MFRKIFNGTHAIVANKLQTRVFDFCLETSASIDKIIANFKHFNIPINQGPII